MTFNSNQDPNDAAQLRSNMVYFCCNVLRSLLDLFQKELETRILGNYFSLRIQVVSEMLGLMVQKLFQDLETSLDNFLKLFRFSFLFATASTLRRFTGSQQVLQSSDEDLEGITLCDLLVDFWHLIYWAGT